MLSPEEWQALRLSALVGVGSVAVTLVPGVALGWLLARRRFPGHALLDALVHLPLVLPPVVVGYLLLWSLGRRGWLGGPLGLELAFTWQAAMLAAAVMGLPLMVRAVRLSIELVDPGLEDAAATLGANPWRVFWTVTLPLAWPGVITGVVLAFARSFGEFGATMVFAGNIAGETRTLPLAIYTFTQQPGGDSAAIRLVLLSVAFSLGAVLAAEWLARRTRRRRQDRGAATW